MRFCWISIIIHSPGSLYGSLTLEEALSGRSCIRNKTLARTLEKINVLEGWGSGFKRIFAQCEEYGIAKPEFLEIGDMLRVNFYRPSYKFVGDKSAIKTENGDKNEKVAINTESGDKIGDKTKKVAINTKRGDKKSDRNRAGILEYLAEHSNSKTQDISKKIGLKISQTKVYLAELVEEGKIISNGANRNRTYSLR